MLFNLNIYSESYFKAFSSISSRGADRVLVLGVDMVPKTLPVGTYFQAELDTHKQNCFLGFDRSET
jgi:hypothetical protein